LGRLGSGADVVSEGELMKALKAKIKPSKIVFSGVGKTETELKVAIQKRVLLINIESESEARLIDKLSRKMKRTTSIGIRISKEAEKLGTDKSEVGVIAYGIRD